MSPTGLLLFIAVASTTVHGKPRERITRGSEAEPHEFPSLVSIQRLHSRMGWYHYCGGVLIDATTVLTAAHCQFAPKSQKKRVVMGQHQLLRDWPREVVKVDVKQFIVHPDYNIINHQPDIMLIKLDTPVPETDVIRYARLPLKQDRTPKLARGQECTIVGWGRRTGNGPISYNLQKGRVELRDEILADDGSRSAIFAYPVDPDRASTCSGDSGGPLYCPAKDGGQPFVVGSLSGGDGPCGSLQGRMQFARTDHVIDWIREKL